MKIIPIIYNLHMTNVIESPIKFNEKQRICYDTAMAGKSCFITGPGGTGKSFLIKHLRLALEAKYDNIGIAVTSTTGVSANVIGGCTLHSYLGILTGQKSCDDLYKLISKNPIIKMRWKRLKVLIIDEVSMLSIELFEKLESLARLLRTSQLPFGGIQLVLTGDFAQLPPVKCDSFIFESPYWPLIITHTIYLTDIIRQTDDAFRSVLNKVRLGLVDDSVQELLSSREIPYTSPDGFIPTMLYATNRKVSETNKKYFNKLVGTSYKYDIKFKWHKKVYQEKYSSLIRFEQELDLKVGAQVMYLTNAIDGLFNGSRGIVKEFVGNVPNVLFDNGLECLIQHETLDIEEHEELIMSYTQLPLKLAWAISIHKAQGCTLSLARIDTKNIFECGQFYVAISRVKDLSGLFLRNLNFNLIKTNPKAAAFYAALV